MAAAHPVSPPALRDKIDALRAPTAGAGGLPAGAVAPTVGIAPTAADARAFSDALRAAKAGTRPAAPAIRPPVFDDQTQSISQKLVSGLQDMSGRLQADHRNISRLIETAAQTGDDRAMMKAMLALADYQQRVQMMSKSVAKAGSSLDQLTRLQ